MGKEGRFFIITHNIILYSVTCSFDLCRIVGRIYSRDDPTVVGTREAGDCCLVIFLGVYNNNIRCDTRRYNTEIIIDRLSIAAVPTLLHPYTQPLTGTQDLFLTFTYEYGFSFFILSLFWVLKLIGASNHYYCVVAVIVVIVMYERWTKGDMQESRYYIM